MDLRSKAEAKTDQFENKLCLGKSKCQICAQEGNCIIDICVICEFCLRKVIFTGVSNIKPIDRNLYYIACPKCGKKRLKKLDETRFCNCL